MTTRTPPTTPNTSAPSTKVAPADVQQRKAVIDDVLAGRAAPAVTRDDLLQFAVAIVEAADPAWLEARLKDARFSVDHRTTVGLALRGPLRRPVLTALGVPPFLIG
jgi:hypothetical protein